MLSRKHRFRGQKAIEYVYRKGRSVRAGFLTVKAVPAKGEDYRLAVVVSRKVNKSAVTRNRIRRRLYEQFRLIRKDRQNPIKYDMVLSVYDDKITKIPPAQLKQTCEKLLRSVEET
ncbi:ribonuclease P protein component [Candidatus Parcubacteria bacterium]|nr:ribonuclease P protein component [Candidatus Parcubacteria bacterium]